MRVLVAVASKHGATRELAAVIADELGAAGHAVDLLEAGAVGSLAGYGAAVLGSALYMGAWLPEARRLVSQGAEMRGAELRGPEIRGQWSRGQWSRG